VLTLENGKEISLEGDKKYQTETITSTGELIIYKNKGSVPSRQIVYNYLSIPRGGQFKLQLSDGSVIWLNSETKIKYPKHFIEEKPRDVELLYGEAYFDVSHLEKAEGSEFTVITQGQKVSVLGTKFNIKAYADEDEIVTTLVKGEVMVSNTANKTLLKPDYQAILTKNSPAIKVVEADTEEVTSWIRGEFSFKNKSLLEITKVLARWYDVRFIFENDNLKFVEFNGVINKDQDIETLLNILKNNSNINYEIKDDIIILK
jgi:ferric-dicitrate binding protein FerR (iron transport regulator)